MNDTFKEEEYRIWRKNVPHLYDLVYTQSLKWPTPSVQWFPDAQRHTEGQTAQRLLLTTYTEGTDKEHLLFAHITFPDVVDEDSLTNADIRFKFSQSIPLNVDVNKARYSPLATNIIACRSEKPEILIYDYTKHPSSDSTSGPDAELDGHSDGGFALCWNPHKFGELASGGRDKKLNIYEINSGLKESITLHDNTVNDVVYSKFDPNILCSVDDDGLMVFSDTRSNKPATKKTAHTQSIESCDYSPFKSELITTSSSDMLIKVWDTRTLSMPLYSLRGHKDSVLGVKWSVHYESILGSASKDRRVIIWDLNKNSCGEDTESPELLFVHGGHQDTVDDFDWNPAEPMEIASVSSDGMMHVWKIPIEEYI